MSGITSLYVGVSGLKSSQNAINTTSHNLANVNTEGYVRQQVVFADTNYINKGYSGSATNQVGLGVNFQDVRRVREILLDKAFRTESGRRSFYEEQQQAVDEAQEILGELNGVPFGDYMSELWKAIQEVEKDPSSIVSRSSLIQNAVAFITRAEAVYDGFVNYQSTLNTEVVNKVNRINEIGERIFALNKEIAGIEGTGIENANDLRDERDNLLDELSGLIRTEYTEDETGIIRVRTEGVLFVDNSSVNYMGYAMLDTADNSDYYTPTWPLLGGRKVFNLEVEISTPKANDIGSLKGVLLARGSSVADYRDIPDPADPKYQLTDGAGNFIYDYAADLDKYRRLVEPSAIKSVMAEFDQLIHCIVEKVNNVLCPDIAATEAGLNAGDTLTAADGSTITVTQDMKVLDRANAGYGSDDNKTQGTELFSRKYTERYTEYEDASGNKYMVYNTLNEFGLESLYKLGNLEVNKAVLNDRDLLGFKTAAGEVDQQRANKLADEWNTPYLKLGPDYVSYESFIEYYSEFVGQIGNTGDLVNGMISYQDSLANGIDNQRLSITGVSSQEELAYLIQFQSAYNAASRYITVIDQMLEHIVTRL